MACQVVINISSGSVPSDAEEMIVSLLKDLNEPHVVTCVTGEDLSVALSSLRDNQTDSAPLIVWGGDGTIACALSGQRAGAAPILALPGGTMNLLPKAIHGDYGDWREVLVRSLRAPVERRIPAGRIGGSRFYIGALFGKLTQLAMSREAIREGALITAVTQTLGHPEILDMTPQLSLQLDGRDAEAAVALGVFLGGPDAEDQFDIGLIAPGGLFDLTSMALEALMADWRTVDGIEELKGKSMLIRNSEESAINCTLDGEAMRLDGPVEVVFESNAAVVLAAA